MHLNCINSFGNFWKTRTCFIEEIIQGTEKRLPKEIEKEKGIEILKGENTTKKIDNSDMKTNGMPPIATIEMTMTFPENGFDKDLNKIGLIELQTMQ